MRRLDTREVAQWLAPSSGEPAGVMDVTADTPEAAFHAAIARIHQWIEAGDTYQVNFTQRLRFAAFGNPLALYAALRAAQPVPYA
ncbi:chorismate-binding protein, partial [Escherichia coli]|uniref:chorismate-binding protein n=1 Tax=Escherichia coli TaxID=562 RepID=UPI0022F1442A